MTTEIPGGAWSPPHPFNNTFETYGAIKKNRWDDIINKVVTTLFMDDK